MGYEYKFLFQKELTYISYVLIQNTELNIYRIEKKTHFM